MVLHQTGWHSMVPPDGLGFGEAFPPRGVVLLSPDPGLQRRRYLSTPVFFFYARVVVLRHHVSMGGKDHG